MKQDNVILITGGAGYIGCQLVRDLATDPDFAGMTLRIYDNLHRQHYCGLMHLPAAGRYEFIEDDILNRLNLQRAMRGARAVIHLAALVRTPISFDYPEWTKQVNQWGTAAVVECALTAGVEHLIFASSASVYGPGGPFGEDAPCRPVGPYALSKLRAEQEVLQGHERGLPATIARLATVYGVAPAMRFDAAANHLTYLAGVSRPLVVRGSGQQHRPLIHIQDASAALRSLLKQPETAGGQTFNVVTGNPTFAEIAQMIQALKPETRIRYTDQELLTEISFEVDGRKLRATGFAPQFDLRRGIETMLTHWRGYQRPLQSEADFADTLDTFV